MEIKNNQSTEITYNGELKISDHKRPTHTAVQVKYNKQKAQVSFVLNGDLISFSATHTENGRRINEKVMDDYILSGVSNIDDRSAAPVKVGKGLQSFSFHIIIDYFSGESLEIYFTGNTGAFVKRSATKKRNIFRSMAAMF